MDEVEVTDVADARIWKAFVESYLTEDDLESEKKNTKKREKNAKKRNILVCTSNFKPKQLYKGGLNWKSLLVSEVFERTFGCGVVGRRGARVAREISRLSKSFVRRRRSIGT